MYKTVTVNFEYYLTKSSCFLEELVCGGHSVSSAIKVDIEIKSAVTGSASWFVGLDFGDSLTKPQSARNNG